MNLPSQKAELVEDKAGRQHWDQLWSSVPLPAPIDPRRTGIDHHVNRTLFRALQRALDGRETRGAALLEVGCGQSAWLPVFAQEFGFAVSGLDYSDLGCERARQLLRRERVPGRIVCADLFSPPEDMACAFDVVVSLGVVEHFDDTPAALSALAGYLRPGGRMITLIPNMKGICGLLQRAVSRPVFEMHVPLNRSELVRAHAAAGLSVRWSAYVLAANLCVVNMENLRDRPRLYAAGDRWRWRISKACWMIESALPLNIANRWTSPYVIVAADRTA